MQKIIFFIVSLSLFYIFGCKSKVAEKPFVFNGRSLLSLVEKSINGDSESIQMLNGLVDFSAKPDSYNKIAVDSININNSYYYTLLVENQNPAFNLFAVIDKDLNLILKDESLNGYLNLNFKKSGSRIFAVVTEQFNSKDVISLTRVSYYSLEQYAADLVFRQFVSLNKDSKNAEQVISVISDTAIVTSIFFPDSKSSKTEKEIFKFDVAENKYSGTIGLFDSLVYREIRTYKGQVKNPEITDVLSMKRFLEEE